MASPSTPLRDQEVQDLLKDNTTTTVATAAASTTSTIKDNNPSNPTTPMTDSANDTNPPPPQTLENPKPNTQTSQPSEAAEDTETTAVESKADVASASSSSRATNKADVASAENGGGGGVVCVGRSNRSLTWGSCVAQGMPKYMEDFVAIVPGFLRLKCDQVGGCRAPECKYAAEESPIHYFGLFDGHGGSEVSHHCSQKLHELLPEEWGNVDGADNWCKKWEIALTRAFNRADNVFQDGALAPSLVGSTAVVVILSPCQIIVANCGDSRAVLCRGSQVIPLSVDHKLDRSDEFNRITTGGAQILYLGGPRVEGILNMSRAIGDHELKKWVISDPEVTFTTRSEEDECLILASDGLWDVKSNDDVMRFARRMLREQRKQWALGTNSSPSPAQNVAEDVVRAALYTSYDNISVIVVDLKRVRRRPQQGPPDA